MDGDNENSEFVFQSDFYEIKFWTYGSASGDKAVQGFTDNFCLTYVHSGNFLFDLFHRRHDLHTGYILIDKPGYEFSLPPASGRSTILRFYPSFYTGFFEEAGLTKEYFFSNSNLLSLVLKSVPELDYLHHQMLQNRAGFQKLKMDVLVMEFLNGVVRIVTGQALQEVSNSALEKYHSSTIEKAKEYMHTHFAKDISLKEISTYACTSPFHFSRVFKQITSFSPYRYLLNVRLKHAEMLLKNSPLSINEVAFSSGFRKPGYFATSFKQKFSARPNQYRKLSGGR